MNEIKDGDFYKRVEIEGVTFEIFYRYSSEEERARGWEPLPCYPDFEEHPQYTKDGYAFAIAYQDVCKHYQPIRKGEPWCDNCKLFDKREKYIGICQCQARRERQNE